MSWKDAWVVFSVDFTNTLRDRRTWLAMIVIPLLLVPVLLIVAPTAMEGQRRQLEASPPAVAVVGQQEDPELVAFMERSPEIQIVSYENPWAALEAGDLRAVVTIQSGAMERRHRGEPVDVIIEYDASNHVSEITRARVEGILAIYSQEIVFQRLSAMGIEREVLVPLRTEIINVAPEEKVGRYFLAFIMPLILAMWASLGGMYAAIDAVAGEKERGTLEPLLATPPTRGSLVAGKYATVVVTSVIASMIALLGMYIAYLIRPEALGGGQSTLDLSLPIVNIVVAFGVCVLLAGIFGALQLTLSAFARSFREAQSYLSPISVAIVIPGIITQFSHPADVAWWMYLIPLVNAMFMFKQVLMDVMNWRDAVVTLASSLVFVTLSLRLAVATFHKESVLFRT